MARPSITRGDVPTQAQPGSGPPVPAAAQAVTRGRRRKPLGALPPLFFWGFLAPALFLTLLFTVLPFLQSFPLAFQEWKGFGQPKFVGLDNLRELVTDSEAHGALGRTILYTAGQTIGTVGIGTALAIAFHRKIPFATPLKFLAFLPVILPPTFVALAWQYALNPTFGWINDFLGAIDPSLSRAWLSEPDAVLWIVIAVGVLQYTGIPMILMLSALNDIPREVDEAATLDGVNAWQRIVHITLPLSRNVLVTVIGLQMVANFKFLDSVWALTEGGPGRASDIIPTFIYREAFSFGQFGYGSAAALVSTAIILAVSLAYTYYFRPREMSRL